MKTRINFTSSQLFLSHWQRVRSRESCCLSPKSRNFLLSAAKNNRVMLLRAILLYLSFSLSLASAKHNEEEGKIFLFK
jgi:hypothetical protein